MNTEIRMSRRQSLRIGTTEFDLTLPRLLWAESRKTPSNGDHQLGIDQRSTIYDLANRPLRIADGRPVYGILA